MGQHKPLLRWILLLDLNIPRLKKKIGRDGGITELLEVTVISGYLTEIYVSVKTFASSMDLLLGLTG